MIDVQLAIFMALGFPMSAELDGDGDGIPDACVFALQCGSGTVLSADGTQCEALVNQSDVDAAYAEGFAAAPTPESNDEVVADLAFNEGFDAGVSSVDITSDNDVAFENGFNAGVSSVDITADNQDAFDEGYAEGLEASPSADLLEKPTEQALRMAKRP